MKTLSAGSSFRRGRALFQTGKTVAILLWLAALIYLCVSAAMAFGGGG